MDLGVRRPPAGGAGASSFAGLPVVTELDMTSSVPQPAPLPALSDTGEHREAEGVPAARDDGGRP